MEIGFIGLGLMGEPMALNLVNAGVPLVVWNRTPEKAAPLAAAGATVAGSVTEVFARSDVVFLMLSDEAAMDDVLHRSSTGLAPLVRGRTVVHTGTTAPGYSIALGADIAAAGGRYIECPVSGSQGPAQAGELVALPAGDADLVDELRPLLAPLSRAAVFCGPWGSGLRMKLAINLYLITMVTGLVEAVHFAERSGLDVHRFLAVHDAGPMASVVSRGKAAKLAEGEFSPQAAVADVLKNAQLVASAARADGIAAPLLESSEALFRRAAELGHGSADMVAVVHAIRDLELLHSRR